MGSNRESIRKEIAYPRLMLKMHHFRQTRCSLRGQLFSPRNKKLNLKNHPYSFSLTLCKIYLKLFPFKIIWFQLQTKIIKNILQAQVYLSPGFWYQAVQQSLNLSRNLIFIQSLWFLVCCFFWYICTPYFFTFKSN